MICLHKADEGTFRHLAYNQSPPALAPSATTCQDLNGISNLRAYVSAGQDDVAGGASGGMLGQTALDEKLQHEVQPRGGQVLALDAGRRPSAPSLRSKAIPGGDDDDQNRLVCVPSSRCLEHLRSWTTWFLSVLFFACLFSHLRASPFLSNGDQDKPSSPALPILASPSSPSPVTAPSDAALVKPLDKRSTCASGGVNTDEYNTRLHAAALFIIWFVSWLACAFPIMAAKFPGFRIPRRYFFAVRHFGTGVIMATAFVHLLPTAFVSLGNPCLRTFWTKDYEAMPGAIALAAIFLVSIIEMVFHPSRHVPPADVVGRSFRKEGTSGESADSYGQLSRNMGPLPGRSSSLAQGLSQLNQAVSVDDISQQGRADESAAAVKSGSNEMGESRSASGPEGLTPKQKRNKERLQCILLEMGILFHSVFIGMALSVSIGSDFIVLLIAIIFHQTFEGLALGSRISIIDWGSKAWQPWLMALAYGCTTPLGQAIGLTTHNLYSPDSKAGLILVGVMNAISAGLLIFASLVELLSEDFLSDKSWRYLRGRRRVIACLLVFFGAFSMSLVGAWA